ncbi:MAG: hypothetical protein HGB04_06540 [Chlorobiaceae bacterium]|nr:hypothetical protein [Chlorobiaceae bacterium]
MSRNAQYSAIFALLAGVAGIRTASKRLRLVTEVPPVEQPAMFLVKGDESLSQPVAGAATRYERAYEVFLYVHETDPSMSATEKINPILDSVAEAFRADAGGRNSLGGTVYHCWIDGTIEIDDGALENQGGAHFVIKTVSAD